jgi:hypothetical protein
MNLNDMTENVLSIIYSFSSHKDKLKMVLLSKSINEELKAHREWRMSLYYSYKFFKNNEFQSMVLERIYSVDNFIFVLVSHELDLINFIPFVVRYGVKVINHSLKYFFSCFYQCLTLKLTHK